MSQETKLKKKEREEQKEKEVVVVEKKSKTSQKLALHALQKHLHNLKLKEYLLLIGFTVGGALLRIPMQEVPSAEPITFFAILAGWLFGRKKGFFVGASAGYLSNFFMFGGQGPWSPFQMLGWGIAGFLGGSLGKKSKIWSVLGISVVATLAFDIIMNSVTPLFTGGNIFIAFLFALPYLLVHLVSNLIFCSFLPFFRKLTLEKGGFNEREIAISLADKLKRKFGGMLPGKTKPGSEGSDTDSQINRQHNIGEV